MRPQTTHHRNVKHNSMRIQCTFSPSRVHAFFSLGQMGHSGKITFVQEATRNPGDSRSEVSGGTFRTASQSFPTGSAVALDTHPSHSRTPSFHSTSSLSGSEPLQWTTVHSSAGSGSALPQPPPAPGLGLLLLPSLSLLHVTCSHRHCQTATSSRSISTTKQSLQPCYVRKDHEFSFGSLALITLLPAETP